MCASRPPPWSTPLPICIVALLSFSHRCARRARHAEEVQSRSFLHFTAALAARPPPLHLLFPTGTQGRSVVRLMGAATASSSRLARQHPSLRAAHPVKSYSSVMCSPCPHLQSLFFVDDVTRADELVCVRLHSANTSADTTAVRDGVRTRVVADSMTPPCPSTMVFTMLCLELVASRESFYCWRLILYHTIKEVLYMRHNVIYLSKMTLLVGVSLTRPHVLRTHEQLNK
jgi:hypothetical protein